MIDSIYAFVVSRGYISIFVLMALLPTEAVMPVAGYLSANGDIGMAPAILIGTAGSTFGSCIIYCIARLFDQEAVYGFVRTRGRWLGLRPKNVEEAGRWFDRHARTAVLVGRFVPGLRTAVSLSAGFRHMGVWPFVVYTFIGNLIPSVILAYVGFVAGENFEVISIVITSISSLVGWSLLVVLSAYFLLHRYRH